ncbi:MAG: tRNA-binding protein [Acidimicrobiia bacterium]|nr:tRNA-binding protein [Acidimicrobiia bacterium]NNF68842.1 tRNA-binding protein [Acidimicrobiia bacterium]
MAVTLVGARLTAVSPSIDDFADLSIKVGTVTRAEPNDGARSPALRLWIDFGPDGVRQSSAKVTDRYAPEDLVGTQVAAVTGLEPLRVGGFRSDVLVIGALTPDGVVLLRPDGPVADGSGVA